MKHFYITLLFIVSFFNILIAQNEFIITWRTTTANETITIPTTGSGYNYSVDWGDSIIENGFTGNAPHEYAEAGTHTVKITGDFPRIYFNNNADADKILTVEQWGNIAWTSMESAFRDCNNLRITATDAPDLSNVTNINNIFRVCRAFRDEDFSNWDVSNVTSMNFAFTATDSFNGNLSTWDVGSVINFVGTFYQSSFNQDISSWNIGERVSGTINMGAMFTQNSQFDQNLGSWDISKVSNMSNMFLQSSLSTTNYDATLIGWATDSSGIFNDGIDDIPSGINFNAGSSTFCLGIEAKSKLVSTLYEWIITDGGTTCASTDFFITTWQTTAANEYIRIPTVSSVAYNFSVDWGDGTISRNLTSTVNHEYAAAGTYTVKIYGDFPQPYFDNANQAKPRLQTIEQWGTQQWVSMVSGFEDCPNLKLNADDVPDLSQLTSLEDMFRKCTNFEDLKDMMQYWDVSGVERIDNMFAYCTLFNEDVSGWSFDNLKGCSYTFRYATTFNQDVSNWDVSNVEDFESMFEGAEAFDQPIGAWTIGTVEYMISMFKNATSFNQDLSTWDISNVEDIEDMFLGATRFNQDLSSWDISNIRYIEEIFVGTAMSQENYDNTLIGWATLEAGETQIPLGMELSADTTYCLAEAAHDTLTSDTYKWTITDGGRFCVDEAFITTWAVEASQSITIPVDTQFNYDYRIDWGDGTIENNQTGEIVHTYTDAGTYTVSIVGEFPAIIFNYKVDEGTRHALQTIEQWGAQEWLGLEAAFYQCINLKLNADDVPNLSSVTSLSSMFSGSENLEDLKDQIGNWNLSNISNISFMFSGCSVFNEDIGDWTFTQLENANHAFKEALQFNQDISNWNMLSVKTTSGMFDEAETFNQDISAWNMSAVENTSNMFRDAVAFNQDISGWDMSNADYMLSMLEGALSFNQNLANWDLSKATNIGNTFSDTNMSQENYDATLIGWATLEDGETQIPIGLRLDADATYCLAEDARNTLTSEPYEWEINDAGRGCTEDAFITTWSVGAGQGVLIPVDTSFDYKYHIDWGDGTQDANLTDEVYHTYANEGTYTITITGEYPAIVFDSGVDQVGKDPLQTIEQWGTQQWLGLDNAFLNCVNLKLNADDVPDLSQITSVNSMFKGCTNLEDEKDQIGNWDMTTIRYIQNMFKDCTIFNENIGSWTFTNLAFTYSTFENATAFNQDISNWNMSIVVDMDSMFKNATLFNQPIGNWTLGNSVDYISSLLEGATSFNQDLSNWDFSHVYDATDLFKNASSFNQDLSAWDISKVRYMNDFFTGSGMTQENYDNTLIGWATLEGGETEIPTGLTLNADIAHCLSVDAVNTLTGATYNWIINDGGLGCIDPVITLLGDNPQTVGQGGSYTELGAEVTYGATLTIDATSLNTDQLGSYTVTYDAVNPVSGSSATQVIRTVNVVDLTDPIVTCQNITVQLDETGNASITATQLDNGTTDISGIASLTIDVADFDCSTIGENTVVVTAVDNYGNSSTCIATVIVEDTIAPVFDITSLPEDIEVGFTDEDTYVLPDFTLDVVTSDNCDSGGVVTITQDPISGTLLGAGTHSVTLIAADSDENESSTVFEITVNASLDVDENLSDEFILYPNPVNDRVWVAGLSSEAQVAIYDFNGKILKDIEVMNDESISVVDLPLGVYLVEIIQGNDHQTIKLVRRR
ncbi:BspA family leucine-rich repeat surface protein [Aquimarina pacifica]|uniref:BspA family leucine-rich repeat surface protein n=1 Tax=Aquimarina pacifica TaxID=1296415 RepID=UPI0004723449|nr:BspA family leucine-rich repeat surface protein [Aquimarina pacifica]